jgi:hypothetical protein
MGTVDMDASLKTAVVGLAAPVFAEATSWAAQRQTGFKVGLACNSCR